MFQPFERMIIMKKIISLLCAVILLVGVISVGVVSASAVEAAQTIVDIKSGDKVTYTLTLGDVPERIVGCDFSIYYDSSAFELDSVADFTNSTDDWSATINPDLDGEVIGNWSILKGVDFSKQRNFVTLNLTATDNTSAHLSYYVRYMYGNSAFESDGIPQIDSYTFACDVSVNGKNVLENANPELNIDEPQSTGLFVNSVTGKSDDAGVNLADNNGISNSVDNNSGHQDSDISNNGGNSGSNSATGAANMPGDKKSTIAVVSTDAEGNTEITYVEETSAASGSAATSGSSPWIWIIIGVIVIAAGGGIAYFLMKNKKEKASSEDSE